MIETNYLRLVSDELDQFYRDAERDKLNLKLLLHFPPEDLNLSLKSSQFSISEPPKKFRPRVKMVKSRKSNKPNMF